VVSTRRHAWTRQRVKDLPAGGTGLEAIVEVIVRKPRWVCAEQACDRRTFVQVTDQLPFRARCVTRLRAAVLDAVVASGRAVDEVAAAFGVAWWTVQAVLNAAVMTLPEVTTSTCACSVSMSTGSAPCGSSATRPGPGRGSSRG